MLQLSERAETAVSGRWIPQWPMLELLMSKFSFFSPTVSAYDGSSRPPKWELQSPGSEPPSCSFDCTQWKLMYSVPFICVRSRGPLNWPMNYNRAGYGGATWQPMNSSAPAHRAPGSLPQSSKTPPPPTGPYPTLSIPKRLFDPCPDPLGSQPSINSENGKQGLDFPTSMSQPLLP